MTPSDCPANLDAVAVGRDAVEVGAGAGLGAAAGREAVEAVLGEPLPRRARISLRAASRRASAPFCE